MSDTYSVRLDPEEQWDASIMFIAVHPELPGCIGHGASVQSAIDDLDEARLLYIRALVERGLDVPRPNIRRVS